MAFSGMWKRYGCCPKTEDDLPSPPQNLIVFEVTGYNYRTIPMWFDETGQKMLPLQFSVVYDKLYYRWTFYKRVGSLCKHTFHLSTSDDIVPVIYESITGTRMNVKRITRHNGYTNWKISC